MYKAILCDDDEIILDGLKTMLEWNKLGIDLCACANNGAEAEKMIRQIGPDILITDVKMPFQDGLTLAVLARDVNPETNVIIISGYDDFSYAQKAIKVGAVDYILKPIAVDDFVELLRKTVAKCKNQNRQSKALEDQSRYMKEHMIHSLIYNGGEAFLHEYGHLEQMPDMLSCCYVLLAALDNFEQLTQSLPRTQIDALTAGFATAIQKTAESESETGRLDIVVFTQREDRAGFCLMAKNIACLKSGRDRVIRSLQDKIADAPVPCTITIACGAMYDTVSSLGSSYQEACRAMKQKFVRSSGSVIEYKDPDTEEALPGIQGGLSDFEFIPLIRDGDKPTVERKLADLKQKLLASGGDSHLYMCLMVANLYTRLLRGLEDAGIELDQEMIDPIREYRRTVTCDNLDSEIGRLKENLFQIIDSVKSVRKNKSAAALNKAVKYIDSHYADHDLSIEKVASQAYMSPSHFSIVFKAKKNITFTDYLIRIRMEKAKEYMDNTDYKIYEISDMVGYDTVSYFSVAFKKYTGISPSAYKNRAQG